MADEIRCQMCGKPNPADAEVCQFCQARLRPVWASKSKDDLFGTESESESEGEVPDWLSSLRGPEESTFEQSSEEQADTEALGGLESREGSETEDWLADLGKPDEVSSEAIGSIFELEADDNLSELLSEPAQSEEKAPDQTVETPDTAAEPELFSEEQPAEPPSGEETTLPDWLDQFSARPEEEEAEPKRLTPDEIQALEQAPAGEGEVPDWLTRMSLGETELPAESSSIPDWMKDATPAAQDEFSAFFSSEPGSAQASDQEVSGSEGSDSGVDWMTGVYGDAATGSKGESDAEAKSPPAGQDDFPEWLSALGVTPEEEAPLPGQGAEAAPPQEAFEGAEKRAFDQSPDWLSDLGSTEQPPLEGTEEEPAAPVSAFDSADDLSAISQEQAMPDWLAKLDTEGTPSSTGGPSPFVSDEAVEAAPEAEYLSTTPDWLSQVGVESADTGEGLPHPEIEPEPGLERAELPNWLEAMRPVEAVSSEPYKDVTDNRMENEGPLAGLRGALPVGPRLIRQRKPVTSTLKIQVPEEQQNRAIVLQKLLEDESTSRPLPAPALAATPTLLRLIVFSLFAVASIFAIWLGGKQVPLPALDVIPQGVQDFHNQVGTLPAGLPVLFAVDYEPGFSGELDGAAGAILGQLARQKSLVTFVSTTYNGPALAQRLVDDVNQQPEFSQVPFTGYRNMGYIPGGSAGLSAFARTPDLVLPYDLNDRSLWNTAPFDPSRGLKNFAMVIVVTHDADTARNWIEQVGPTLGDIPLQAVVSAQAEPLVQPYYAGIPKQITGMVTGLPGGVAYETLEGRNGKAAQVWDAYSITLTLAIIFILVGGVFGIGSQTLSLYKVAKAEGKA